MIDTATSKTLLNSPIASSFARPPRLSPVEPEQIRELRSKGLISLQSRFVTVPHSKFLQLTNEFSCPIITEVELNVLTSHGNLIDFGARNGYVSYAIQQHAGRQKKQIDTVALDLCPADSTWSPVQKGDVKSITPYASDRTLLLCWPPEDNIHEGRNPMAVNALETYLQAGGKKVIYIGAPEPYVYTEKRASTPDFFRKINREMGPPILSQELTFHWLATCGDVFVNAEDHIKIWEKTD